MIEQHQIPPEGSFEFITYMSIRITGVILFFYAMNFSTKMIMSNQHNYVINEHKQNALLTFLALVNSAAHEDNKDIILTYAADCIYSHQDSGFNDKSTSMASNPAEQIVKLAETLGKSLPKSSGG